MEVIRFEVGDGMMTSNAYLFFDKDTKDAVIVDPGYPDKRYLEEIEKNGLKLNKILLTHGHYDHIGGIEELREKTGAKVYVPEKDELCLVEPDLNLSGYGGPALKLRPAEMTLKEGDVIEISPGNNLTVMETPGHSPGSTCFLGDGFVVVGDVLFEGSIGRTDFPTSNMSDMMNSLGRLMELDDKTLVLPGHGRPTTIGLERQHNPFLTFLPKA